MYFRHNEDGSYTYGYEAADGTFKIETKLPTGEVKGKYGYVDDVGKVRVVEYGATKYGFEPSGEGITVAPPTLVDETTNKDGVINNAFADPYYEPVPAPSPPRQSLAPRPKPRPQPASFDSFSNTQQFAPAPQRSAPSANFDYVPQTRPQAKSFSPAPLRPQTSSQFSFTDPAPVDEQDNYAEPAPPAPRPQTKFSFAQPSPPLNRPAPQFPTANSFSPAPTNSFAPAPQRPSPPQFAPPRPQPVTRQSGSGGGVLDQLAKDYALPQGGAAPLHDISFGYY